MKGQSLRDWILNHVRSAMRSVPMIFQTETTECALACLAMAASFFGHKISIGELRERFGSSLRGLSLRNVIRIADEIGLTARPIRCDLDELKLLACPALLHWDLEHFVVLKKVRHSAYVILDPARGERFLDRETLSRHFTGIAVELAPKPSFARRKSTGELGLATVARSIPGLPKAVINILVLTLSAELLALATPLFTRAIVDHSIGPGSLHIVQLLCGSFAIAIAFHVVVTVMRDYSVLRAASSMSFHMVSGLIHHLMRLRISFFESRQIGDLINRYQSAASVRDILASGIPLAILDGLLALASLSLVALVSPVFALISLTAFLIYFTIKMALSRSVRARTLNVIHHRGEESGFFIESLRCVLPIKAAARELERWAVWVQKYVGLINAERQLSVLISVQNSLRIFIIGADIGVSLYAGSSFVAAGQLSYGVLLAMLMYKSHFAAKSLSLVDRGIEFSLASLHLARLGDVAFSAPEQADSATHRLNNRSYTGALKLSGVSFRYSPTDPLVLQDLNLQVDRGDVLAIIGKTGEGKTTLIKLLLGLYRPTTGTLEFDGQPVGSLSFHRQQFGVVLQDDQLLVGTIAENIAFFEPQLDMERVIECAQAACIHEEITRMPMQYHSRVGELGSALSGGQRQRLLIARALYRRPAILLLDEGTANLDPNTEKQVLSHLESLNTTRIYITHSAEVRRRATRVLQLAEGRLSEISAPRLIIEG